MKTVKWVNAPPTAMGSHSSRPGSTDTKSKKDTEPEGTIILYRIFDY